MCDVLHMAVLPLNNDISLQKLLSELHKVQVCVCSRSHFLSVPGLDRSVAPLQESVPVAPTRQHRSTTRLVDAAIMPLTHCWAAAYSHNITLTEGGSASRALQSAYSACICVAVRQTNSDVQCHS